MKGGIEACLKCEIPQCVSRTSARMAPALGRQLDGFAVKPILFSAAETAAIQRVRGVILRKSFF